MESFGELLFQKGLISEEKINETRKKSSHALKSKFTHDGKVTTVGMENANDINKFRQEIRNILLQNPSHIDEIVSVAHKKFPQNKKLHAQLLSLRKELSQNTESDSDSITITIIKKWLCKSKPKEWRGSQKKKK
ncbi:MAG: hypothetical protein Q8Q23_06340 [bacterium]|nr:hypothetical protein [bacterium]